MARLGLRILSIISVTLLLSHSAWADSVARVGVLACRGSDMVDVKWSGLQRYLDSSIEGWTFKLIPITLSSAGTKIENGELDFLVTNPGHFVDLNYEFPLSVIVSRRQLKSDGTYASEFGSAIITRTDSGITHLQQVSGKTVAAIDRNAFGGFQTAWREFDNVGVDLFTDTAELSFVGFPMDQIIRRVLDGSADIGIVRSGLVEELIADGAITDGDLSFLNANVTYTHPDRTSTRLYPEWPFAATNTTDPTLRDAVALALLMSEGSDLSKVSGMNDLWSAPLSYRAVEELALAYRTRTDRAFSTSRMAFQIGLPVAVILAFLILLIRRRPPVGDKSGADIQGSGQQPAEPQEPTVAITKREQEILTLISEGQSTKEIARLLGISPKTVEFHRANLLKKFEAKTSSQLIALAT